MSRKGKAKTTPQSEGPKVTMLQKRLGNEKGGNNAKPSSTRGLFIKAFEESFGNITLSCERAGIARLTYYRWMKSDSRVNRKFREQVERIRPNERLSDLIEGAFAKRIIEGSDRLIQFGLERKVQNRGWDQRPNQAALVNLDLIAKLHDAFQKVMVERPGMADEERALWIRDFAASGGVPEEALSRRIKVQELTEAEHG